MRLYLFTCLLLLTAAHARAFTLLGQNSNLQGWQTKELKFNINTANCPAGVDIGGLFNTAAALWNSVDTSNLKLSRGGDSTSTIAQLSGGTATDVPVIACDPGFGTGATGGYDPNAVVGAGFAAPTQNGVVAYGYLLLNVKASAAANIANIDATKLSVVMAHEIAHVLGLGHSQDKHAIMYYDVSAKTKLNLAQDDIDGISYLYPRNELSGDQLFGCGSLAFINKGSPGEFNGPGAPPPSIFILLPLFIIGLMKLRQRRTTAVPT